VRELSKKAYRKQQLGQELEKIMESEIDEK